MGDLTVHFNLIEFSCKCGNCPIAIAQRGKLLLLAQELEKNFRQLGPITITSGIRCAAHNAAIGGENNSRHLPEHADAADFEIAGHTGIFLKGWAEAKIDSHLLTQGGLGLYVKSPNLLHYDRRGTRARWVH